MARQGWGRHTVVATGSNDATKQVSVNAWNNDLNETGMLGFDLETKTLSSDALTPLSTANTVAGEGASADDFSFITYGSSPDIAEEDILFFYKGSQVITVTHNTSSAPTDSGNIQLLNGASKVLDTNLPLILQRKGNVFYEIVSSAGTAVTAGSTTTFTNKSIDLTDNTLTGSSAELATAISDETGSGLLVFGTSPTFVTPVLGQPASGNLADCTFPTLNQSTTGSSATCTGLAGSATNVITTDDSSDTTCNVVFVNDPAATQAAKTGTNLTFNASTGLLTATLLAGDLTGDVTGDVSGSSGSCTGNSVTATTATNATNVALTNEATDTTCFPLFVDTATGNQDAKTNTGLTFNSNTGLLTSTLFAGDLTGDVTGDASGSSGSCTGLSATATALATGRTIGGSGSFDGTANVNVANLIVADTTNTTCSVALFEDATGDNVAPKTDGGLTYNATTGMLTATGLTGPLTGNASGTSLTVTSGTQAAITTCANLVESGALDAGSITSGFGNFDNGSSTITTTGALASGAITTSGTLTMGDNIITGIKSLDTDIDDLAWNASTVVDFDTNEEIILGEITGTTTFTSTNRAKGKHKVIHMDSNGSANTLTESEGWVWYGTKPTATTADKKSILSLVCLGTAVGDVRAVFVEQAD